MNKEKVEELHRIFKEEVSDILRTGEKDMPKLISVKITQILTNSKKHNWGIHDNLQKVKESFLMNLEEDQVKSLWYEDLNTRYKKERDKKLEKVIQFYIDRFNMSDQEKKYYKQIQYEEFRGMQKIKEFEQKKKDLIWEVGKAWREICEHGTEYQYQKIKEITEGIIFSDDVEALTEQVKKLTSLLNDFGKSALELADKLDLASSGREELE